MGKEKSSKSKRKVAANKQQSDKRFKCTYCEYTTSHSGHHRDHIRTHTGERPFQCSVDGCGKRFRTKSTLNEHVKRCKGLRNHKCANCEMAFVCAYDLKRHVQRSHN